MNYLSDSYVEETRFGFWFLRSHTWQHHVLRVAINDLRSLFSESLPVNVLSVTTVHRFSPVPRFNRGQMQTGMPAMLNGTAHN